MPEPSPELGRYLSQPLDELLEELSLYREQATGGAVRGGLLRRAFCRGGAAGGGPGRPDGDG